MTIGGWICMLFAIGIVSGLFTWCCFKVLTAPVIEESAGKKTPPAA
ncbi:MAG: hypothetical protein IJF17_07620 [Thermoguttaceae bacterium]|nr:hypothetical protein [Thermoguttaceae bacterium]MDO4425297.1 hypothetical protein [Planctomycetia bacterium]